MSEYKSPNTILGYIIDFIGALIRFVLNRMKGKSDSFKMIYNGKNEEEKLNNELVNRIVGLVIFLIMIVLFFFYID